MELKDICNLSHCDVTILVSTSFIIYRKVELHKKKIIRNLKYLKFSFEKTIIGNIDNFHTVILKYDKNFCYVAAVEHELMSCWLKWLDNAGISISLMIPDVLTLPFSEDKCSLLKLDSQWLIRNGEYSGFSIKESIFDKIHLVKDKNLSTNRVNYISEQQKKAHLINFCDALSIMAENINKDGVNFLSGKYSRYRERKSGFFPPLGLLALVFYYLSV
ncbi:General secretion pathway protein L [Yersinia frederiksenii ATCC 33641]|nr:General secretion pathway protein L [Yersinia frederiksenii ATCC 33641]